MGGEREWVGHVGNTQLWEVWESLVSDSHSHSDADSDAVCIHILFPHITNKYRQHKNNITVEEI